MATSPTTSSGDSADPKRILNDLAQLAAVCQRLGIDLSKVAAMGQSVGGKAEGSLSDEHRNMHPGGGTGYQNYVTGGTTAASNIGTIAAMRNMSPQVMAETYGRKGETKPYSKQAIGKFLTDVLKAHPDNWRAYLDTQGNISGYIPPHKYNEATGPVSAWHWTMGKNFGKPRGWFNRSREWVLGTAFGKGLERRMLSTFTTMHGMQQLYTAMSEPIHYQAGETVAQRIISPIVSTATYAANAAVAYKFAGMGETAWRTMRLGSAIGKARGAGFFARTAFAGARAAGSAGPQILIMAAVEAAVAAAGEGMAAWSYRNENKYATARYARQLRGELHTQWVRGHTKDGEEYLRESRTRPFSPELTAELDAKVDEERNKYWVDEFGRRRKRRWLSRFLRSEAGWVWPLGKLWAWVGSSEEQKKEREWRFDQANKYHEMALQKARVMDWRGAKEEVRHAKDMVVSDATSHFFWKDPDKYLQTMESSRIAARNWARAMQPRGASRVGD